MLAERIGWIEKELGISDGGEVDLRVEAVLRALLAGEGVLGAEPGMGPRLAARRLLERAAEQLGLPVPELSLQDERDLLAAAGSLEPAPVGMALAATAETLRRRRVWQDLSVLLPLSAGSMYAASEVIRGFEQLTFGVSTLRLRRVCTVRA